MADGASEAEHKESAERQFKLFGFKPSKAQPEPPKIPELLHYLWNKFIEIYNGTPANGMGPPSVSWETLDSWSRVMKTTLLPWEYLAIIRLSVLKVNIDSKALEEKTKLKRR